MAVRRIKVGTSSLAASAVEDQIAVTVSKMICDNVDSRVRDALGSSGKVTLSRITTNYTVGVTASIRHQAKTFIVTGIFDTSYDFGGDYAQATIKLGAQLGVDLSRAINRWAAGAGKKYFKNTDTIIIAKTMPDYFINQNPTVLSTLVRKPRKKAKPKPKKVCKICGPTHDYLPDWGKCPHES